MLQYRVYKNIEKQLMMSSRFEGKYCNSKVCQSPNRHMPRAFWSSECPAPLIAPSVFGGPRTGTLKTSPLYDMTQVSKLWTNFRKNNLITLRIDMPCVILALYLKDIPLTWYLHRSLRSIILGLSVRDHPHAEVFSHDFTVLWISTQFALHISLCHL